MLNNKYKRWYDSIIEKAKDRLEVYGYHENHHIIPRSLGGTDDPENIVKLLYREHYLCHWLLCKFVEKDTYRMYFAFFKMAQKSPGQKRKVTARMYETAKKYNALGYAHRKGRIGLTMSDENKLAMSENQTGRTRMHHPETMKQKNPKREDVQQWLDQGYIMGTGRDVSGSKNPMFGKPISENARKALSEANLGRPSWNKGKASPWTSERNKANAGLPRPGKYKSYIVTFPDGHSETIHGMKRFCEEHGLSNSNICSPSGSKGFKAVAAKKS